MLTNTIGNTVRASISDELTEMSGKIDKIEGKIDKQGERVDAVYGVVLSFNYYIGGLIVSFIIAAVSIVLAILAYRKS